MAHTANASRLLPTTRRAFDAYVHEAETEMDASLRGSGGFLWSDLEPALVGQLQEGHIEARFWSGQGPVRVSSGLIHDWVGAVFIPHTSVAEALALVQDYDQHKVVYQPEVIDSAVIKHRGNHFNIYLRLLKKKIVTAVLDTEHDVNYVCLDQTRWFCRSHSTRIAEVENAGRPNEHVLPPDTGHGFLWRLYSYWQFEEKKTGTCVECRAISLTRDVPLGLGWIIEPIIQNLPRESLVNTLRATRQALRS